MLRPSKLFIVMPCYNEQDIIRLTISEVSKKLDELIQLDLVSSDSAMLFVDDGSIDATWKILVEHSLINSKVKCIKLSANVGTQKGLIAGLTVAKDFADLVITMDSDLQHDINSLNKFVKRYHEGFDIVYGVRNDRETDTYLRKITAIIFYNLMINLGVNSIKDHSDFRLISAKVLEVILLHTEYNLFLRSIVQTLGFKQTIVKFDVKPRLNGESKYNFSSLIKLALDGITSFSIKPLRLISFMGVIVFLISLVMMVWNITDYFRGISIPGWASLSTSIWFLGGLIILSIGVVGEYIGKIYSEVKQRPRFIIEEKKL